MKRFRFRLQQVLRIKRQLKRQAELEVARAAQRLRQLEQQMADCDTQLAELARHWEAATRSGGGTLGCWDRRAGYSVELHGQRQRLAEAVRAARELLSQRRQQRQALEAQVEGLQTLRRDQYTRHQQEEARQWQHELDEFLLRDYTPPQDV